MGRLTLHYKRVMGVFEQGESSGKTPTVNLFKSEQPKGDPGNKTFYIFQTPLLAADPPKITKLRYGDIVQIPLFAYRVDEAETETGFIGLGSHLTMTAIDCLPVEFRELSDVYLVVGMDVKRKDKSLHVCAGIAFAATNRPKEQQ